MKVLSTSIIVLAAGSSTRFEAGSKLAQMARGRSVIEHTLEKALSAGASEVCVVGGSDSDGILSAAARLGVRIVKNSNPLRGMASSIVAGVASCPNADSLMIWPGDMPAISVATVHGLLTIASATCIVVPVYHQERGHPVIFGRSFVPELLSLRGKSGARPVLDKNQHAVFELDVDDPGVLFDIDTAADLDAFRQLTPEN